MSLYKKLGEKEKKDLRNKEIYCYLTQSEYESVKNYIEKKYGKLTKISSAVRDLILNIVSSKK